MIQRLREAVTAQLMRVEIVQQPPEQEQNLPYMEAHHIDPTTGEDDFATASLAPAFAGNGNGTARDVNPKDPTTWGQGRPQRSVSLRLGQEIQALPRAIRLISRRNAALCIRTKTCTRR